MINFKKLKEKNLIKSKKWAEHHDFNLIVFNLLIVFLFLLRSAGYFQPYFVISINFIVIVGLLLSILLLEFESKTIFFVALLFWMFAGFLKIVGVDVWAERTGIYAYESLIVGVLLLSYELLAFGR